MPVSVGAQTLDNALPTKYAPIPLLGPPALELFGGVIIGLLYDRIPKLLEGIYSDRPQNADGATAVAISRGAVT